MKFCFIVPPSPWLIDDRVFPPLGILYLSRILKLHGYEVQVVDLTGNAHFTKLDADVVGFTGTTQHFPINLELLRSLKHHGQDAHYVIGGPHATCLPEQCLSFGFDQVVVGEGEQAILKIAQGCKDPVLSEPWIQDLDSIPFPDWDAIDIHGYRYYIDGVKSTIVTTSRGCPYECGFCSKTWPRKVRFRSPENVVEEVRILKEHYGFEGIMFFDDTFVLDMKRVRRLCELLKPLDIVWRCETRVIDDRGLLAAMAKSGCREIAIGVESGSDEMLKVIKKGITVAQAKRTVRLCHEAGIRVKAFLMIGLPGESRETVEATRRFIREAKPDDVDYAIFTPYPNSPIYNDREKYDVQFAIDYSDPAWIKFFGSERAPQKGVPGQYTSLVRTSHLSEEEIVKLRDSVEREVKEYIPGERRFVRRCV